MIELPEAVTLARQLGETVTGRRAVRVSAGKTHHGFAFFSGDPGEYPALLEGRTVDAARSFGGRVELAFGERRLSLNDGVNLRYLTPGTPEPERHQLYLLLDDGSALVGTIQMYGGLWTYVEGENDNFYHRVAVEKPSPLSAAFDQAYFNALCDAVKPKTSAKALLATEQRIPGLGNGCLQDILYRCGVHPKSTVERIDRAALFQAVKKTLSAMAEEGGRDTEKDLFGRVGGYQLYLSSKTWKGVCPKCGNGITRQAYLGGNVYFCPRCQPLER